MIKDNILDTLDINISLKDFLEVVQDKDIEDLMLSDEDLIQLDIDIATGKIV